MKLSEPEKKHILIIHGPNLNLLGEREPEIYGSLSLQELNTWITESAQKQNLTVSFFQSNHEGKIIDYLHDQRHLCDGIIINPGAFTHYSYALHDAIVAIQKPTVEVHLSDIHKRESFRRQSVIKPACISQISGLGKDSYTEGLKKLIEFLRSQLP